MYTGYERFTTDELINRVLNNGAATNPLAYELARRLETALEKNKGMRRALLDECSRLGEVVDAEADY